MKKVKNNRIQQKQKIFENIKFYVQFFYNLPQNKKKTIHKINKKKEQNKIMIIITKIMSKSGQQKYWTIEKKKQKTK